MRITVVIPCYNQATYLSKAVTSVLEQSHADREIIVVNDGSTDETDDVAEKFDGQIYYISQANGGVCAARNAGILAASGDFVLFLDADDFLFPGMLKSLANAHRQNLNADVLCSGWRDVDGEGAILWEECAPEFSDDVFHQLLARNCAPCNALLIRRALFARSGMFDTKLRAGEDRDMWIRLAHAGAEFARVPDAFCAYRRHPGTVSGSYDQMWRDTLSCLQKNARAHGNCPRCRQAMREGLLDIKRYCFERSLRWELYDYKARRDWTGLIRRLAGLTMRDPGFPLLILDWLRHKPGKTRDGKE